MNIQLSPEDFQDMADMWGDRFLDIASPEKMLAHLTLEERLAGLTPEDLTKIEAYLLQQKRQRTDD